MIISGSVPRSEKGFNELLKNAKTEVGKGGKLYHFRCNWKTPPTLEEKFESNSIEGLPFSANLLNKGTTWTWAGKPSYGYGTPVFQGLLPGVIMQEVYQNVHPKTTMMIQEGKMISGVIMTIFKI